MRVAAALGVLLHHALHGSALQPALARVLPQAIWTFDAAVGFRVPTLFLVSGFFAAYALRNSDHSGPALAKLLGWRQARLALPYWAMLVFGILLIAIIPHQVAVPLPRLSDVAVHLLYLQQVIPDTRGILGVAWTLCIDFQFFIVFAVILYGVPKLLTPLRMPAEWQHLGCYAVLGALGIFTAIVSARDPSGRWFFGYWHYFAAGTLTCRALLNARGGQWLWCFSVVLLVIGIVDEQLPLYGTSAVALSIYAVGRMGRLEQWGDYRIVKYFAARSYSLYLVHLPIVWNIENLGFKLTGSNLPAALGWFCCSIALGIAAAHWFHRLIEMPSAHTARSLFAQRWARDSDSSLPIAHAVPA